MRNTQVRVLAAYILLLFASPAYSQVGSAPQLLTSASNWYASFTAPKPNPGALRQRLVTLNIAALHAMIAPGGSDTAPNRITLSEALPGRIALQLFPDLPSTFRRRNVEPAFGGGYLWKGDAEGSPGSLILVVNRDRVTAHIELKGRIFLLEPVGGDLHRVTEIDANAVPADGPHLVPPSSPHAGDQAGPPASYSASTTAPVDLLVLYTKRADDAPSDIVSDINLAVTLTNNAYANSSIKTRLQLVGTMLVVPYDEASYDYTATLYNLTDLDGGGSSIVGRTAFKPGRLRRDQLHADLVALVREGGSFCGQGWVIEQPNSSTSQYGYAQISRACISTFALAHELGHTMGLLHDRYVEPSAPATKYNFGYVNVTKRVRDIMSYSNRCTAAHVTCQIVNKFSNPRIQVQGAPFGIAAGTTGAADASRRLGETYPSIMTYR